MERKQEALKLPKENVRAMNCDYARHAQEDLAVKDALYMFPLNP